MSRQNNNEYDITTWEYNRLSLSEFSDREIEALERLNKKLGKKVVRFHHQKISFCNWVGVIGIGGRNIEILPKIERNNTPVSSISDKEKKYHPSTMKGKCPWGCINLFKLFIVRSLSG